MAPGAWLAAVRLAAGKKELFFSEAIVCGFMHAARTKMQARRYLYAGCWVHAPPVP